MNTLANCEIEALREDGEFAVGRVKRPDGLSSWLLVSPVLEQPVPATLAKLENAWALRDALDAAWAARPVELVKFRGRLALAMEDPGGESLDQKIDGPLAVPDFLRLAISIASSLGGLHGKGLVHKDVKPANLIANARAGEAWLTGFSLATRLPRHRQSPEPPEVIAGTLAYMAPEQTGRMNRSIDSRSDLYSLGVTFYEMLVGALPFTAGDPMEWVHCHIARLPVAPHLRRSEIPEPLSAIILKLLAKAPEERYQTSAGLVTDLRRCLSSWEADGRIESFSLGAQDVPDRLLVPEKLYGREKEIALLLAAFDRVVREGTKELVLVSGYSGVGKSSVVNELHKALVPPRGLFASGKFDQYKRDIPYAMLAQAFQMLVRQILVASEAEVDRWRHSLLEALGPNGQLIVNLIPEVEFVIGKQPPVAELPPQEARGRFQLVFRRFLGVFARPEHPLALFLDDLQWLDTATLDLLERLITDPEVRHVLLIGAYRDNEVSSSHPLMRTLSTIRDAGAKAQEIVLAPIELDDVERLITDALRCEPNSADPLALLVHEKTGGNPFFAIQFLMSLAEEGLLRFEGDASGWIYNLGPIRAKRHSDNVVDLMVAKLNRLPATTQKALQRLACIGNSAKAATLSAVLETSEQETEAELWEALHLELIVRSGDTYRFVHDCVQEAAHSLIAEDLRAEAHLRIGRLLHAHIPPEKREESIFEIVNQFNRGAELITSENVRYQVAELNLVAGERAKASTAYASALKYCISGEALLKNDPWEHHHNLIFQLELRRAECEFLTGDVTGAAERLEMLRARASNHIEAAMATCLSVDVCMTLGQIDRAVGIGLDYLHDLAIEWPLHPTEEQVRSEYARLWSKLGNREIEDVVDFPLMRDPTSIATLDVLTRLVAPATFTDTNLSALVVCRAVGLSIEHGNSDGSCTSYVWLGLIMGPRFGDYKNGFRFGQLGCELTEQRGLKRFQAATFGVFAGGIMPWMRRLSDCSSVQRQAIEIANKIGDLTYAGYTSNVLNTLLIAMGGSRVEVQREVESSLTFARKSKFGFAIDLITPQLSLIKTLRGLTPTFGSLDHAEFEEQGFERDLSSRLPIVQFKYWARKLQARLYAGDFTSAIDASLKIRPLLGDSPRFEWAEYEFYGALARAVVCESPTVGESRKHFDALKAHYKQLQIWAENCPENFEDRVALVGAEIARIEGQTLDAMDLYEHAIRSARANEFVQNEGLAHELAAQYYLTHGLETAGYAHLRNARYCYLRWGADGKVRQLDRLYPHVAAPEGPHAATLNATIGAPVGQLDAETVARASQALSSEIVLPKLIERLMRIALEHAGAERGLLILLRGSEPLIEAEAATGHGRVQVQVRQTDITPSDLPTSALQYVIRTRERVVLDDASVRNSYSDDAYWEQRKAKSVLCLPIVKQTQLIGVLYLENNLAAHVFTSGRVAVLEMLASQAAISLENARLYTELEQENLERRRAEDALKKSEAFLAEGQRISHTGSWGWNLATDRVVWSEEHCRIFGYNLDQVGGTFAAVLERLRPEERPALLATVGEAVRAGRSFSCEYQIVLPDGLIKYVQSVGLGVVNQLGDVSEYIGTTVDITERKRAEEELRRNEAALREAQAELAHVARVTTMGELAASIAHEVNQPIAGVVINGNACLRWLAGVKDDSANLTEARETLQRIIRDGNRAGEIVARIRALFKKVESAKESLDLNEAICEIIELAKSEMEKRQVALRLELSPDFPNVLGDRVQLQQVMLNLILNAIDAMTTVEDRARDLVISTQTGEDGTVLTTVRDTGIGLSPETIGHVFEAFHTTKPGGLGVGLSISRSIVENHSGRLWVTAHDGPGASFHFTLLSA